MREREREKEENSSTSTYNSVETRAGYRRTMIRRGKKEEDRVDQREEDAEDCIKRTREDRGRELGC